MKAQRCEPTPTETWVEQPKPVVDGPHRTRWKKNDSGQRLIRGVPGVSCVGPRHEEDIDTNGYYQLALRALEE